MSQEFLSLEKILFHIKGDSGSSNHLWISGDKTHIQTKDWNST